MEGVSFQFSYTYSSFQFTFAFFCLLFHSILKFGLIYFLVQKRPNVYNGGKNTEMYAVNSFVWGDSYHLVYIFVCLVYLLFDFGHYFFIGCCNL